VREHIRELASTSKGFLAEAEGLSLYRLAVEISGHGPCLEIGSYCGKSALYLGEGCRARGRYPLFTVDHHAGSEEQQPGELYFDPALYDAASGETTTLTALVRNIRRAGLQDWIIPIVAASARLGRYWPPGTLSLVFIDGGHSEADAIGDYEAWSPRVKPGGYLCIHDIHPTSETGGQAPYHALERARASGRWEYLGTVETLGILKRR
jgi:predicted O-methyltransferase YrrM